MVVADRNQVGGADPRLFGRQADKVLTAEVDERRQSGCENVNQSFGDFKAVDRVSLSIEQEDLRCWASSCGKTTTLRMLAGFEQPDRGPDPARGRAGRTCRIQAQREHGLPGYALFEHLKCQDNVAFRP